MPFLKAFFIIIYFNTVGSFIVININNIKQIDKELDRKIN